MNESLGQRIKRLRRAAGLSQAQLADACGWKSQSRVGNYEAGTREPTLADIASIATALQVEQSQLLLAGVQTEPALPAAKPSTSADLVREMLARHGKGICAQVRQRILDAAQSPAEDDSGTWPQSATALEPRQDTGDIHIPQYDIRGAMGHGQVPSDYCEAIRNVVISPDVLREKGVQYSSRSALAVITGWGQSMEGTINDKDPVIVDRGINEFVGDGVYVITWHDLLYIKRLQVHDADHYELISDNAKHKDRIVPMADVIIHAKVLLVWNAQRL